MNRTIRILTTLALLSAACSDTGVNNSNNWNGAKIRKITLNQSQYTLYHYDRGGNLVKYELFGRDSATGRDKRTVFEEFIYSNSRLTQVMHYVLYNDEFKLTGIEQFEYDERNRVASSKTFAWSEITDTWNESLTNFHYNENDQLVKREVPGWSIDLYFYDANGNMVKQENHPIFALDYVGALVTTYTYDNQKNPFHNVSARYWLPLANGASATGFLLSPNNVLNWDGYSPQTGGIISRGSIEYEYNVQGYPISARETMVSPLTDPQPGMVILLTEYEYIQ